MSDSDQPVIRGPKNDSLDLVSQTRSLRRKVVFWRRTAWLAVGMAGIIFIILWQRGQQHQQVCEKSLRRLFQEAVKRGISQQPPELLEEAWLRMPSTASEMLSSHHYNLIKRNWSTIPAEGEPLPMAICSTPHAAIPFSRRNVLFYDGKTITVKWTTESAATDIIKSAERDDGP